MEFRAWMMFVEAGDYFSGFKGWYDYNRGDWKEVEEAAKKDPRVRMLIHRIQANLDDLSKAGPFGDQLEAAVERWFPDHSKRKARANWEKQQFHQFGLKTPGQGDITQATRTASPGDKSDDLGFRLNLPGGGNRKPFDTTELSGVIDDHERRLRNLEAFLKSRHSAHTVGMMNAGPGGHADATVTHRSR